MWGQPSLALVRIKALDQGNLFWRLVSQVVPAVLGVVLHAERRALAVTVNVPGVDEVNVGVNRTPISNSQRVMCDDVLDRPPDIDDTDAELEKTLGFIRKILVHAFLSSDVRLVGMHTSLGRHMSLN